MKNLIICLSIMLFICICQSSSVIYSQTVFQRTIGGPNDDVAKTVIQTTDGGCIVAGYTTSYGIGSSNGYFVKFDASGLVQWAKAVGKGGEEIYSITQTQDGGYAAAGIYWDAGYDIYIVKLNSSGIVQWSKSIYGVYSAHDYARSIVQTTNGNFVIAGGTPSFNFPWDRAFITKFNSGGTFQTLRTYGSFGSTYGHAMIKTSDGGFAIAGYGTLGNITKLDSNLNHQWSRGGSGNEVEWSLIQTTDGGYAMTGYTGSDVSIIKLDSNGILQWGKSVGGTGDEGGLSIIQSNDGGFAVTGYTNTFGAGMYDVYLVKLDTAGSVQWTKTFGGTNEERAASIIKTSDGGYIIAGTTKSFGAGNADIFIIKFDANWNTCSNVQTVTSTSGTLGPYVTNTSAVYSFFPTVKDTLPFSTTGGTVTTQCLVGIQSVSNENPELFKLYQNYPNPFNPNTKIKFQIPKSAFVKIIVYDLLGREITNLVDQSLKAGAYEVVWNAINEPSGTYFYTLQTESYTVTKKLVLLK